MVFIVVVSAVAHAMLVVAVAVVLVLVVMVVFMLMLVVVMVMVVMLVFIIVIIVFVNMLFYFVDPCGGSRHLLEVEQVCVHQLVEVHVAVVAFHDFRLRLYSLEYLFDSLELLRLHVGSLVQQYHVAELDLLYHEVLDVIVLKVLFLQVVAASELALQSHCIDNRRDAVQSYLAVLGVFRVEVRHRADCLRDRRRLADSACLYHDVVKLLHRCYVVQLLHEVHLQRAADASVLQRHEAVVLLSHDSAFLYQFRVYVHFADVVHYDGEFYAFLV